MSFPTLAFGIEMELLFKPSEALIRNHMSRTWTTGLDPCLDTDNAKRNREALYLAIAREMTTAGIAASTFTGGYQDWSILDERTLDERKDFWRVEIVSRCMTTEVNWQAEITTVFNTLNRIGEIKLTKGCSMHVHVSPSAGGGGYRQEQLHGIMKAIAYYDQAITEIVPQERKQNTWAASNFAVGKCDAQIAKLYANISSDTWQPLFQTFDQVKFHIPIPATYFPDKLVSWNFKHLCSGCGTVEFRRPPGVDKAADALYWTAVTLGFIQHAIEFTGSEVKTKKESGEYKELAKFISDGLSRLGPTCGGIIQLRVYPSEPTCTLSTPEEKESIEAKKRQKLGKESNFAVKVDSRPSTAGSGSASP